MDTTQEYIKLKERNFQLVLDDEYSKNPICKGLPIRMTWTGTGKCNIRCSMCQIDRRKNYPYPDLPTSLLEGLVPQLFPTLQYINMTRRGEPFLDKSLPKIIELCDEYSVKLNIITNGLLLTESWSQRIIPYLEVLKVSIDGAKHDTNVHIRNGVNTRMVLDNLKQFIQIRNEMFNEKQRPPIIFEITLRRSNIHEILDIIKLAKVIGVDGVKGYHLFAFFPEFESESLVHDKERYNETYYKAMKLSKDLDIKVSLELPYLLSGSAPQFDTRPCPRIWRRFWIDFNGDIVPCHHPSRIVVGNAFHDDVLSVWNSKQYQDLRTGQDPRCKRCGWRLVSDKKSPIPIDDEFFTHTWKLLEIHRNGSHIDEKPIGAKWEYLWSRRTAQMPLP